MSTLSDRTLSIQGKIQPRIAIRTDSLSSKTRLWQNCSLRNDHSAPGKALTAWSAPTPRGARFSVLLLFRQAARQPQQSHGCVARGACSINPLPQNSQPTSGACHKIKSDSKQSQSQATDKEIVEMLVELLRHLGATFLVFDGVDECSDYVYFLRGVTVIGSSGSCALLLISR